MRTTTTNSPRNDSLAKYYKEVETTKMLSAEAERELIKSYQATKDPKARDLIIQGALRYVIAEARKHPRSFHERLTLEDLIAAGNIGLIRALGKFNPEAGTRFLTYASWWVRHEMREEGRRLGLVHVPAHAIAKGARTPNTTLFIENSADDADMNSDSYTDDVELQQSIVKLFYVTNLSIREIFIVKTSFGIHTPPKTLKQIGRILDITGERVRQLRETAINKLRNAAARPV